MLIHEVRGMNYDEKMLQKPVGVELIKDKNYRKEKPVVEVSSLHGINEKDRIYY